MFEKSPKFERAEELKKPETKEEILWEFQEKEKEALIKNTSRFKNLFVSLTTAAVIMISAPAFGEMLKARPEVSKPAKVEKIEREKLKSAEALKLFADLEKDGYSHKEISGLLEFTQKHNIPLENLNITAQNMHENSDKLMLLKTYSIAHDAIFNNKLSPEMEKRFKEHVLPHLENGIIDVIKLSKEKTKGSAALYDSDADAYKDTEINLTDAGDRAITIHELVHVSQDALKLSQKRENSEEEAYSTQHEYLIRESGLIKDGEKGETIFSQIITADKIKEDYAKIIIYKKALKNSEKGKNNLNTIFEAGIDLSSIDNEDAINFYKAQIETISGSLKSSWAFSTNFSNMISGKMIDTEQTLKKDGLKRLHEK